MSTEDAGVQQAYGHCTGGSRGLRWLTEESQGHLLASADLQGTNEIVTEGNQKF